jgi:hypothetical protein
MQSDFDAIYPDDGTGNFYPGACDDPRFHYKTGK